MAGTWGTPVNYGNYPNTTAAASFACYPCGSNYDQDYGTDHNYSRQYTREPDNEQDDPTEVEAYANYSVGSLSIDLASNGTAQTWGIISAGVTVGGATTTVASMIETVSNGTKNATRAAVTGGNTGANKVTVYPNGVVVQVREINNVDCKHARTSASTLRASLHF